MTTDRIEAITPSQLKAARALLGWSQADLARASQLGPSTVADFERNERTPQPNNLSAMRAALEGAGLQFLAGGAVVAPDRKTARLGTGKAEPFRWVTSTDLGNWGDRRDGQDTLPELISKLILASLGEKARIRFPANESVQIGGWDGTCEAPEGDERIPEGWSGWELGTQRTKVTGKADSDYELRTEDASPLDRQNASFVFVTPRRWKGKAAWEKKRNAEKKWRTVRAYDADDLVHWIELYPQVGLWLAKLMGKRPIGIRDLEEVWREWSLSTRWPMSAELLLAGRDEEAARVLRWQHGQPSALALEGQSTQEAIAFVYAALSQLPDEYRAAYEQRCLVVSTAEAARQIGLSQVPLTIVLEEGEPGLAVELIRKGHHVLLPHGSAIGSPDDVIRLPRPSGSEFSEALGRMGIEKEDAAKLTRDSARNLSVLRRLIPSAPGGRVPVWAEGEMGRSMIPFLLAGAWTESVDADKRVLAELSGEAYETLSARLARWAGLPDNPFRRAGTTWKVASPLDVWLQLAPQIRSADLERFAEVTIRVLSTPDPRFGMKSEERWMGSARGKRAEHSTHLRAGLVETLVLLSVYGQSIRSVTNAQARAQHIVGRVLDGADAERWWSVSKELRSLAEASPDALLDALDTSLARSDAPVVAIFHEDAGPVGGAHHSELLWGLEQLAWSPRYLGRVVLILGALARLDPGGKYVNRPKNSLLNIFRPWMPQTSVALDQRLQVLDRLRKAEPNVAWDLMVKLLPGGYDTATAGPQMRWREFASEKSEPVTYALLGKGATEISARLNEDAGSEHTRWIALVRLYPNLPSEMRERAVTQLVSSVGHFGGEKRLELWDTVRSMLHHHRMFPDAEWALPEDQLAGLNRAYEALTPDSFLEQSAWLFTSSVANLVRPTPNDLEQKQDEHISASQRRETVGALLQKEDVESVFALAKLAKEPALVGFALVEAEGSLVVRDRILMSALSHAESGSHERMALAFGIIRGLCVRDGVDWAVGFLKRPELKEWPEERLVRTLLLLPATMAVWRAIPEFGVAMDERYWSEIGGLPIGNDPDAVRYAIEKFLSVKRAVEALFLAGRNAKQLSTELLLRVLSQAAQERWPESAHSNDVTMFIYWIETLLGRLDRTEDVLETDIARLEWQYLAVLEHSRRPPATLHKVMATSPEFFVKILFAVYGPSEAPEGEGANKERSIATQAFNLLRSWHTVPGQQKDGTVDGTCLEEWTKEARRMCAEKDIAAIGDEHIGKVLASSPEERDGVWPATAIRELIESTRSRELESGIIVGILNNRGVTRRGLLDGGAQERAIAQRYRTWAKALALNWPRTAALLDRIAQNFEESAQWHDQNAERTDWAL